MLGIHRIYPTSQNSYRTRTASRGEKATARKLVWESISNDRKNGYFICGHDLRYLCLRISIHKLGWIADLDSAACDPHTRPIPEWYLSDKKPPSKSYRSQIVI